MNIDVESNSVKSIFDSENNNIEMRINKILSQFYNKTCIRKNKYPKDYIKYQYNDFIDGNVLIQVLKDTSYQIIGQLVGNMGKIHILITKNEIMIPIQQHSKFDNLKEYTEFIKSKYQNYTIENLKDLNEILTRYKLPNYKILSITLNGKGLVTNYNGYIIGGFNEDIRSLETDKTNYNYYSNYEYETIDKTLNKEENYNNRQASIQSDINITKKQLAYIMSHSNKLKEYIKTIHNSKQYSNMSKFKLIELYTSIFNKVINSIENKYLRDYIINKNALYLNIIANEVVNDNFYNYFFKGYTDFNVSNVDSNEIILSHYDDFVNLFY